MAEEKENEKKANENQSQEGNKQEEKTVQFSQEQFDKIIGDRATRASDTALKKKAKDLGFESIKDMDDAVKAYNAKLESEKDEVTKLKEENEKLKRGNTSDTVRIESLSIKNTFEVEALRNGISKTSAAYSLAKSEGLLADVSYNPETDVVSGTSKAVEDFVKKYPEFVAKNEDGSLKKPVPPNQALRNTEQNVKKQEENSDDEFAKLIRGG